VDIDPATYNIDPELIEAAITSRTRAILPIHLYGAPAPMSRIMEIARKHNLAVIEDCAQAIGAQIDGRFAGTFGEFGCFSFFPTKNLGAYGDGRMLTTNDRALADRARSLRAHGGRVKYHHEELGVNSRLDEVQAAILRVKLPHLESWIERRRAAAARYTDSLAGLGLITPAVEPGTRHVFHQYTVRFEDRDRAQKALHERGIQTMIYYPVPLHLQKVHAHLGIPQGAYPHSETAALQVLSLPMFPELSEETQNKVLEAVRAVLEPVTA